MSLLEKGARLYEESMRLIRQSEFMIQRSGETLARCRYRLQQHAKRHEQCYMLWNAERHNHKTLQAD